MSSDLIVKNISFSYRSHKILDHLSFQVPRGAGVAILGSNGCGKSTLLSILAGVRHAAGASMTFEDQDLFLNPHAMKKAVGYVPQTDPLIPEATVWDNLYIWFQGKRKEFHAALESPAVSSLGLKDFLKKPVRSLSGGMRKRAALGLALINSPDILILDEPAAALDLVYKYEIRDYLASFHEAGGTLLLATHDEEDLDIIDHIFLLQQGKLIPADPTLRGKELLHAIGTKGDLS